VPVEYQYYSTRRCHDQTFVSRSNTVPCGSTNRGGTAPTATGSSAFFQRLRTRAFVAAVQPRDVKETPIVLGWSSSLYRASAMEPSLSLCPHAEVLLSQLLVVEVPGMSHCAMAHALKIDSVAISVVIS
jgi:hypothetical protein